MHESGARSDEDPLDTSVHFQVFAHCVKNLLESMNRETHLSLMARFVNFEGWNPEAGGDWLWEF